MSATSTPSPALQRAGSARRRVKAAAATPQRAVPALRPVSLAVCLLGAVPLVWALPTGPVNTQGQATVQTTAPGQMLIQQQTPKAALDWTSFSIAAGEKVQVVQPGASSVLLNRVLGENPSLIYGALQSNGAVWLINPRGIVFGAGSRVDVGGLVASTLGLNDDALQSGRLQLGAGAGGAGELRSEGHITAIDGSVVLVAPQLLHSGLIEARRVGLAAASEVLVDVEGDGLIFFNVKNNDLDARLQLLGSVRADGGLAEVRAAARAGFADSVLNVDGIVQARGLGARNGKVVIDGGRHGITSVAGTVDVSNASGTGGDARVLGEKVLLDGNARVDASGRDGGGQVRIGGDWQGQAAPDIHNAEQLVVRPGAEVRADAQQQGDGGLVVLWSERATRFHGHVSARGGAVGGNGGLAEVSGKEWLDFQGTADLSAAAGLTGTLLLDPTNIEIVTAGGVALGSDQVNFGAAPLGGGTSRFTPASLVTRLNAANVVLQATNNITVIDGVVATAGTFDLTLQAGNNVIVNAPLNVLGALTLSSNTTTGVGGEGSNAAGTVQLNQAVTASGALSINNNGGTGVHDLAATVTAASLSLRGNTNITGTTTIAGNVDVLSGITSVGTGGTIGQLNASTYTVQPSAVLAFNRSDNVTPPNGSGLGALRQAGTGQLELAGATLPTLLEATAGTVLVAAGALPATTDVSLSGTGTLNLQADPATVASLALTGGSATIAGTGALTVTGDLTLNSNAALPATLLTAGRLVLAGGALTLSGVPAPFPSLQVNAGATLTTGAADVLPNAVTVDNGGTLSLGFADTINTLTLGGTLSGAGSLTTTLGATLTGGTVNAALTVGTTLSSSGNSTITAAVQAANANVTGGLLSVGDGTTGSLTLATNGVTDLGAGAQLAFNGTGLTLGTVTGAANTTVTVTAGSLSLTGTNTGVQNFVLGSGSTLTLANGGERLNGAAVNVGSGATLTLGNTDEDVASLTLAGTVTGGTLLRVANTLTSNGTAVINSDVRADITNITGGTLTVGGAAGRLSTVGNTTLSPNTQLIYDGTGPFGVGNLVGDANTTVAVNSSTLTLAGNSGGITNFSVGAGGTLTMSGIAPRLNTSASVNVASGGTLTVGTAAETVASLTLGGTLGGTAGLTVSGTTSLVTATVNNSLVANGGLTLTGANTVSALTFTGVLSGAGALGATSLASTGTARIESAVTTTTASVNSGVLTVGNGAVGSLVANGVTTLASGTQLTFAGTLPSSLTGLAGTGTTTVNVNNGSVSLSGSNGGVSNFAIGNGGTLTLASTERRLGTGASVTVAAGGTLTLGDTDENVGSFTLAGTLGGAAALNVSGAADLNTATVNNPLSVGNGLTVTGVNTVSALTLAGALSGTGSVNAGTATLNSAQVGRGLAVSGALTSSGTTTLTAAVTAATTNVTGGVLTVASSGSLATSGTTTLGNNAELAFNNGATTTLGTVAGSAGSTLTVGAGTLNLDGTNTGVANFAVGGTGSLVLADGGTRLGTEAALTVAQGGTLTLGNTAEAAASLTLGGTIGGSAGLTVTNLNANIAASTPQVNNAITVSNTLTVASGVTLTAGNGTSGSVATATALNIAGTLVLNRGGTSNAATLLGSGTINGGTLRLAGGGTLTLDRNLNTLATLEVTNGGLTISGSDRIGPNTDLSVSSGATLTLANTNEAVGSLTLAGTLTGIGSNSQLTANSYTLQAGAVVEADLGAGNLSAEGGLVIVRNSANDSNVELGTLALTVGNGATLRIDNANALTGGGSGTLATVNTGGTLRLGANQSVRRLELGGTLDGSFTLTTNTNAANGTVLNGGSRIEVGTTVAGGDVTVNGAGASTLAGFLNVNDVVIASGGILRLTGDGASGSPLVANRIDDDADVDLQTGGTLELLALNVNERVGGLTGEGTLLGPGRLTPVTYTLNGTLNTNIDTVGLLIVTGNSLIRSDLLVNGTTTINNNVTLTVGNGSDGTLQSNAGVIVGTGATLAFNRSANINFGSSVTGAGRVLQNGTGTLSFNGGLVAPALLEVANGALALATGSTDRLGDSTAVQVNANRTLTLNNASETIGSLTLAGTAGNTATLAGAGVLTTTSLTAQGSSAVNAPVVAGTVNVASGATLALGAAASLGAAADLTINSGGTLTLAANTAVATLTAAGTLGGAFTLNTSGTSTLSNGAVISAGTTLNTGTLNVTGNSTLNGTLAGGTQLTLNGGTLTLGSAADLGASITTVTITNAVGSGLTLNGNENVASFTSAGALGGGSSRLISAGGLTLQAGATVNAELEGATLTVSGNTTLSRPAVAPAVNVDTGATLTLGAADVLANNATVNVATGGVLSMGFADTITLLNLSGRLTGTGTLTATAPTGYVLSSGRVEAPLGGGGLSAAGSSVLAAVAGVGSVNIGAGGTLTFEAGSSFSGTPTFDVAGNVALVNDLAIGSLAGTGNVNLNTFTLTTGSATGNTAFSGTISGSGNLTKVGSSVFTLGGTQAYTGLTTVSAGTLVLSGDEVLANGSSLTVGISGTLNLGGLDTIQNLTVAGALGGTGSLSASSIELNGGSTGLNTALVTAGQLTSTGISTLAGTLAGNLRVDSGTLTLAGAGGRLQNAGATLQVLGGTLVLGGNETVASATLAGTLNGPGVLSASTLLVTGAATLNARANVGSVTVNNGGNLTLAATADRIADGAAVTVNTGGQLTLAGDETVGTLSLGGTLAGAGHRLTADTTLTQGAQVLANLGGSQLTVQGNASLSGTADATAVQLTSGTLTLATPNRLADTANVNVASIATLAMNGDDTVRELTLAGTLSGSGVLTATAATGYVLNGGTVNAALGTGGLSASGNTTLAAAAAAGTVTVSTGGVLTMAPAGNFSNTPDVTLAGTGRLALGSNQTFGSLAGSGELALGSFTLSTGDANPSTFSGLISGSGGLTKQGTGVFTLGGSHSYTGATLVAGGTLALQAANVLPDASALTVNTGGVLNLAGADTVASLVLAGTLGGNGTLTAASYGFNANAATQADAHLGAGTLTVNGNSTLGGTAAGNVLVNSGTLSLAAANRLADTASVTVLGPATLALAGNDTVATFTLAGRLAGSGQTLSATTATLQAGAVVDANLAGATLNVTGNTALNGSAENTAINVNVGTLTLGAAERLGNSSNVTVAAGATLLLGGAETVGSSFTLAGTLGSAGQLLTAGTYTLQDGALVQANLGTGTLNSSGNTSLLGTSAADNFNVDDGTLTLGSADRLADTATVRVAGPARLQLNGNDTVFRLVLSGGLVGTGTLTASVYALSGGTYDTPLGGGELIVTGNSTLNATSDASTVSIDSGTLTLGNALRFRQNPALTVAANAGLVLGGAENFSSISGGGNIDLGSFTLTNLGLASSTFNGTMVGTGGLVKQGSTSFTLAGNQGYTGPTLLQDGTLNVQGTLASLNVNATGGNLVLASANRLADAAAVTVGSAARLTLAGNDTIGNLTLAGVLDGTGTLTAGTVALQGGTVNANLGGGSLSSSGASVLNGTSAATQLAVTGGTLTLAGADRLSAAPVTTLAGGATLRLQGATTLGSLAGSGNTELGSFTLTTGSAGSSSYGGTLSGTGSLVKVGSSIFTFSSGQAYSGATQVQAGTLATTATNLLPDASAVAVASGATLTLGGSDTITSLTLAGTLTGAGTLTATTYTLNAGDVQMALGTGSLVSSGASRLAASSGATTVQLNSGTLTLASANLLADTAAVTVAFDGVLAMGGDVTIGSLALAGRLEPAAGGSTLSAANVSLDGGTVLANLGTGTLASSGNSTLTGSSAAGTVQVTGGTLTLSAANRLANNAQVTVAPGATLRLNGDDTVASLALAGTLEGSGLLSATNLTLDGGTAAANVATGTLASTGNSRLAAEAQVQALNVNSGTLTLAPTALLAAGSTTNVATGAVLALGGTQTLASLAGAGEVQLGSFTLTTGGDGSSSRFDGVISGSGGLSKAGAGTFTLGGLNTYTGATTVLAGTLATAAANALPDTTALSVASGATLALGGNDTIATLLLNGGLQGSATLTAATYTLDGGNAQANLGAGRLLSSGNSTLAGSAAATEVVVTGGSLVLAAANRLADGATVAVNSGATLQLGGDDTITRADIAGTLAGTGTLTAGTVALAGGRVDAALGGGVLTSSGSSLLNATSTAQTVNVDGGTLTLGAAQRLLASPALTLAPGTSLVMAGDETLGSLAGDGNVNLGAATLRTGSGGSSTYGGSLAGSGGLVKQGTGVFTLSGAHGYTGSTLVEAGTLALAAPDRLPDASAVAVASGATLALAGNDTVASLALAGTLGLSPGSSGTLTAATYLLDGGTALASLGAGSLQSIGNSRLAGSSAAATVQVNGGTLTLAAADRLADSADVAVASGATLALSGNDTVGSLALAGTLGLSPGSNGVLSAASYTLNSGTVQADLGSGVLRSSGNSRLDGRSAATTFNVDSGSLTLGAADRLADSLALVVANGAAVVINASDTIGNLTLAGTLSGSGTLTAAAMLLDGGRVDANLGTGTLTARGSSTLAGAAAVGSVVVESGTLTLASAQRLSALPVTQVNSGARLAFSGDQALGSLGGAGEVALGSFTLSTGSSGSSSFAGVISGSGGLIKQGSSSTFTLTGANSYTGATRIDAGTLRVGDGALGGSLASTSFETNGTLSFARSDDITLAQPVSGTGGVEQAGNGRLLFSGSNKTYAGDTVVSSGELATAAADALPDGSLVRVAASARLALGGRETVRAVDADGSITLGPELQASGDLLMRGALSSAGAVQLSGERIAALNEGNRFGGTVSLTARGELTLASGRTGGVARDLVLGTVNAAAGGRVDGGLLSLTGVTTVSGGTLSLVASAPLTVAAPGPELDGRQITPLPIAFAADAVVAETGSRMNVAGGAGLNVVAANGGSVQLLRADNSFLGNLSVIAGTADTPWAPNSTALNFGSGTLNYAVQSRVRIEGGTINVGGAGIMADVVSIRADRLSTSGTAAIVARLPFDSTSGTASSLPALTLELTPAAFQQSFPFGAPGADGGLRVSVGSREYGNRTTALDAGYVTVLPRDGASGTTAVLLRGPVVNPSGGYRFFFDGAGSQTQIPVFYNGVLPTTPQVENSISATVAVSEGARKAGFDDAVRTENVAVRLRAGVIAEVGPAPAATQGTEGLRVPDSCNPAPGALLCGSR